MIGDNVIEGFGKQRTGITLEFKKFAVQQQLDNIAKLLDGKIEYYTCCNKDHQHEEIIITFNHRRKD